MIGVELLGVTAGVLVGLGALENLMHRRRLHRIGTRIHVSGSRGKSSVTRLIASGLCHAGVVAVGKTTGTLPRMLLPGGREVPVFRPAGANIIEQIRIVSAAQGLGAQALVMECMALQPELHWLSENKLVRATHGVITNVRPDHLEVMGPTEADVARTLASMTPVKGVMFTAEQHHLSILAEAAADRGTRLVAVGAEDSAAISDEEMAGFSYVEHKENVALVLRVLQELGVERQLALEGMWRTLPDPGALSELELEFFGRRIIFINGFAANDPESTTTIWKLACSRHPRVPRIVAVFNLRADRPTRTVQLAKDIDFWHKADKVVLMGSGAYLFARVASRAGIDPGRFVYTEGQDVAQIFETIVGLCGQQTLVVGMANIGGQGLGLVQYFKNRAMLRGPLQE